MTHQPHPLRIQRKRTKGFKLPHGTTCVTRPGRWGNPFETAAEFEDAYRKVVIHIELMRATAHLSPVWSRMIWIVENIKQLRGFKLACFCPLDQPCHADCLAEYSNRE
jgi:hypothetical protein